MNEREEARLAAQRKAAEEDQLARARRAEARAKKDIEDKEKREKAREQRQQERWERETKAKAAQPEQRRVPSTSKLPWLNLILDSSNLHINEDGELQLAPVNGHHNISPNGGTNKESRLAAKASSSSQPWELNCEICGSRGINKVILFSIYLIIVPHTICNLQDDGVPLMSCGKCGRWQHIVCHDAADARSGRPKRDWQIEDFTCKHCLNKMAATAGNDSRYHQLARNVNGRSAADHPSPSNGLSAIQALSDMRSLASSRGSSSGPYDKPELLPNLHPTYSVGGRSDTNSPIPRSRSQAAFAFSHYEPHQRGFSSHINPPPPIPARLGEQPQYPSSAAYVSQAQYGWRPYDTSRNGVQYNSLPPNLPSSNPRPTPYQPYSAHIEGSMTQIPYGSHLSGRDATFLSPSPVHHHQPGIDYTLRNGLNLVSDGQPLAEGSAHHFGRGPILPSPSPLSRGSGMYPVAAQPTSTPYHYQK